MSKKATKNDIPDAGAVKQALFEALASGRARSFELISGDVAKALGLSKEERAYRIGNSKNTLFENRHDQARLALVKEAAITYKAGKVQLAKPKSKPVTPAQPKAAPTPTKEKPQPPKGNASAKAPEGRPTKCLSFQQPYASYIVTGVKTAEFRSKKVNTPIRDLVVCASKTPKAFPYYIAGHAYGMAIGMVDVVDCVGMPGDHAWKLENPRLIKPFEVHATAGFF